MRAEKVRAFLALSPMRWPETKPAAKTSFHNVDAARLMMHFMLQRLPCEVRLLFLAGDFCQRASRR
jgi:hypothetical protein